MPDPNDRENSDALVAHGHPDHGLRSMTRQGLVAALTGVVVLVAAVALVVGFVVGGTDGAVLAVLVLVAGLQVVVVGGLLLVGRRGAAQARRIDGVAEQVHRIEGRVVKQGRRLAAQQRDLGRQRAQADRLGGQLGRVAERQTTVNDLRTRQLASLQRHVDQLHLDTERQIAATLDLNRMVPLAGASPTLGGWAASPDLVVLLVRALLERRPRTVVECGSGSSTLYLALAAQRHELPCRIIALEHQEEYAEATRALLRRHGVDHLAEVRIAPLRPAGLADHEPLWYDTDAIETIDDIGMLVVDGPPGAGGPQARYPAVPLLLPRMADECLVVLDDVARADERAVAERWATELPEFSLRVDIDLQKHAALLSRG